jgi:hypothetical protein
MEAQKELSKPRNAVQTGTAWPTNQIDQVISATRSHTHPTLLNRLSGRWCNGCLHTQSGL